MSEAPFDTIITIRDWVTRVIRRDKSVTYHQNDTILLVINGKVEIIDKNSFKNILLAAESELGDDSLASGLLALYEVN
jgi:hypothetical protein